MLQLNSYIEDLPCLFFSPSASSHTQKVKSFTDAELACNILRMCPLKWQDQYHLLEKCYPEGVKPLLLILERIEVAHPVNDANAAAKPAKSQGSEQPSKNSRKAGKFQGSPSMRAQKIRALRKIAIFARSMGARTPRITTRSVAATKKTELLHVEL